ncbi:MAG: histidinol-phosphate transaminase [Ruminococcus sp.]|nr:histidinol-phosphate transaminase [Ruminococcus sp.]
MVSDENFRKVKPYVPGEQPKNDDVIKLNTNENPYPPSPKVLEVLGNIGNSSFRKYPDPEVSDLVQALADYHNVKRENVFVGVGSDDVIAMCFMTFFNGGKPVLFPDISYAFYKVWADLLKVNYDEIPLDNDFKIIPDDYFKENGGIIFPNPNAPTGLVLGLDKVESIIASSPKTVVIVDEAYIDFGGESALSLIDKYDNLIVTRTYSKSRAMAGMRIGYCVGSAELIKVLNSVKFSYNSYTMSDIAIKTGIASLKDEDYFKQTVGRIVDTREKTKRELNRLGFTFLDSSSNFIFAKHKDIDGEQLFNALKKNKIFVRHFNSEKIKDYLRITIGTEDEMKSLIDFLKRYLGYKEV